MEFRNVCWCCSVYEFRFSFSKTGTCYSKLQVHVQTLQQSFPGSTGMVLTGLQAESLERESASRGLLSWVCSQLELSWMMHDNVMGHIWPTLKKHTYKISIGSSGDVMPVRLGQTPREVSFGPALPTVWTDSNASKSQGKFFGLDCCLLHAWYVGL